jgi:ADP-heptose:LPS heptosyltransferase
VNQPNFYHADCRHLRGDLPCKPHKQTGATCSQCADYDPVTQRILIIKLGALGDVIRTTPLVTRMRKLYPGCKITWLTLSPAILPQSKIEEILPFDLKSLTYLEGCHFDVAINLDKDKEAGSILKRISADQKFGFILMNNVVQPIDEKAWHKYHTGLFDQVSKSNTKSYCEEIFEICGLAYEGEHYLLDNHADKGFEWPQLKTDKPIIGLNTGVGARWPTRLWENENWISLCQLITEAGYQPLLLGGEQEHPNNLVLQQATGAWYLGHFSLEQYIHLMDQCEVVVTQVSMSMHLALGLQKKIVLMNNIFNKHEFDLFGNGYLVEPEHDCTCFYAGVCSQGKSCMQYLKPQTVQEKIKKLIDRD